jgi:hypothetical protein
MGNAPDMPELIEDQAAGLMHRLGDPMPRLHLLTAVDAGCPGVTLALHRYLRGLAHDQRCGGALCVVAGGKRTGHIARLACPRAGQWRHDDAMRQVEGAKPLEQHVRLCGVRGAGCPFTLRAGMSVKISIDTGHRRSLGELGREVIAIFGA